MSSPQMLEGEDVATALRDCSEDMLSNMSHAALAAFLVDADGIEVDLGRYDDCTIDVRLVAKPSVLIEATLAEYIRRAVPGASEALVSWHALQEQYHGQ